MKHLITYILLILVSNTISANPNTVIQLPVNYNQLTGELVTPDKVLIQKGLENYQKGHYKSFLRDMKKASAFGSSAAQKYVGLSYINGWGVEKDLAKAYAWIKLASLDKTPKHITLVKAIFDELLPSQVEEAEKDYIEMTKDYGTLATKERRKRWQRKQKNSTVGSRVGARTARVRQSKLVGGGGGTVLVEVNDKREIAVDAMQDFVVKYNFGITNPTRGLVTAGEILPVKD